MGQADARVRGAGVTQDRIRPAATVVLWRMGATGPEVLMGMRGSAAVFMPSKYVFPGGGVDAEDASADHGFGLDVQCAARLSQHVPDDAPTPDALVAAALRELVEETGLTLLPEDAGPALRFIFRAITPPGRSRRFDARFFLVDAGRLANDPEDFSAASGELTHLHWIGVGAARALDLPFITEVVLAEVAAMLAGGPDEGVPFFDNSGPVPTFRRLI